MAFKKFPPAGYRGRYVPPPAVKPLREAATPLEHRIADRAAHTKDTSDGPNHPHIVAYHLHVLRDYKRWLEKNGS